MANICLHKHSAYSWQHLDELYFRGYFQIDGIFYSGEKALNYLSQYKMSPIHDLLSSLNGVFSIIWDRGESVLFAVDRLRGLPLFYALEGGELLLSDDAQTIANVLPALSLNEPAVHEYAATALFVPGRETLLDGIYQVQAGEYCVFNAQTSELKRNFYFQYVHSHLYTAQDHGTMLSDFHAAYAAVGQHLVQALHGRTAVVPLSGGADSRMVLSMLKANHYEKVICFTYGKPGNKESEISRQVAAEYGYPWHFVPYSRAMWKDLRSSPETCAYFDLAFQYVSTPHMQDFPAVRALKAEGILPEDSVFVPGHSGDMIAGSHITAEFMRSQLSHADFLQSMYHKFFREHLDAVDFDRISARFSVCDAYDMEAMVSQAEWFNIQERQAKFIVHSARAYEFFGYEWLIPLWDNALFDFWARVPLSERYQRKLYFEALGKSQLPSTNDVSAIKSLADAVRQIPSLCVIPRRAARLKRYFDSPLYVEQLARPWPYITACLGRLSPSFEVNDLICEDLIAKTKSAIHLQ